MAVGKLSRAHERSEQNDNQVLSLLLLLPHFIPRITATPRATGENKTSSSSSSPLYGPLSPLPLPHSRGGGGSGMLQHHPSPSFSATTVPLHSPRSRGSFLSVITLSLPPPPFPPPLLQKASVFRSCMEKAHRWRRRRRSGSMCERTTEGTKSAPVNMGKTAKEALP